MSLPLEISIQPSIIAAVWSRLQEQFDTNGQTTLSAEELLQLRSLFGETLDRALYILDHTAITRYDLIDGNRKLLEVKGSTGCVYKLLPNSNFCSCEAFKYQVLLGHGPHQHFTCKHVLAGRLAPFLGRLQVERVPSDKFAILMQHFARQI